MVIRRFHRAAGAYWAAMQVLISLMVVILVATIALGRNFGIFEHPMSASAKTQYTAMLTNMSIEQLGTELGKQTSPQRIRLIAAELSLRGSEAVPVLEQYRRTLQDRGFGTRMVLADIRIAIVRLGQTDMDRLKSLENMLVADDSFLVDAAALELGRIGSAEAIAALKSHEKRGRSMIKIARLQAEYGKLAAEPRTAAILESARVAIREHEGDRAPALVAEGTMLTRLGKAVEPFLKEELATLPPQPSDAFGQCYRAFLTRMVRDMQRAEAMKRTATTMPIATMPAAASSSAVSTSSRSPDTVEVPRRQVAAEGQTDGGQEAQPYRPVESPPSHSQWPFIGAGMAIVIVACATIGILMHRRHRQ